VSFPSLLPAALNPVHLRSQVGRVLRLGAIAFAAQIAAQGTQHFDRTTLISATIAAVETLYRSLVPALPWSAISAELQPARPTATTEPSLTIVPAAATSADPAAAPAPTTAPDGSASRQ
jgi:hypothetical protein